MGVEYCSLQQVDLSKSTCPYALAPSKIGPHRPAAELTGKGGARSCKVTVAESSEELGLVSRADSKSPVFAEAEPTWLLSEAYATDMRIAASCSGVWSF